MAYNTPTGGSTHFKGSNATEQKMGSFGYRQDSANMIPPMQPTGKPYPPAPMYEPIPMPTKTPGNTNEV